LILRVTCGIFYSPGEVAFLQGVFEETLFLAWYFSGKSMVLVSKRW
jgi:hypothetical protein